jgi:predicted amidohydrolase YtcJ
MMTRRLARICTALAMVPALGGAQASQPSQRPPHPDLILAGGKVFTADSTRPWAQAVAIRGERIMAVGRTADVTRLAGPGTRRIALGGRVVVPGFIDAHDHVGGAEYGVSFSMSPEPMPDPEPARVLDSVRAVAARTPVGTWLHTTVGLRVVEDTAARRTALDGVAPNHPVLLWAWTGHDAVVNTAGLRALGIPDDVRDPVGGRYGRDAAGRLTGQLDEYAEWAATRRLHSSLPDSALVAEFRRYAAEGLRLGITSVHDMHGNLDPATTTRVLRAARLPIRLRVIPYPMTDDGGLRAAEWQGMAGELAPRTTVAGVKWILDGTPFDRRTLMRRPYADRPGWYGQLEFPVDTVRAILARALATREQLHMHVTGDSSIRVLFGLMQALAPDSAWRPLRVRIEHGDFVAGELLPVARRLGVVVVLNPTHFALDPAVLRRRFGSVPEGFQAARSLVAAGVPVAFGSDGPRSPGLNLMFAVTHPLVPGEALTREHAVAAYTRGSAYAEFAERDKGTLAPGMLADLAVLSQDIFAVRAEALPRTASVLTLVGGAIVHNALSKPARAITPRR